MRKCLLGVTLMILANIAAADTLPCEQCSLDEMLRMGERQVHRQTFRSSHPSVYVINVHDNAVIKLRYAHNVDGKFDWEIDEFMRWADPVVVEPEIQAAVALAHELLPKQKARMQLSSGGGNPASVYEAIHNPAMELRVSDALADSWEGFHKGLLDPFLAFNPVKGFAPAALSVTAKVIFSDKSTALYRFDDTKDLWVRVPETARDAEGNLVPEKKQDVDAGGIRVYQFASESSDAYRRFVDSLDEFEIRLERNGRVRGRVTIVCAENTCRVRRLRR